MRNALRLGLTVIFALAVGLVACSDRSEPLDRQAPDAASDQPEPLGEQQALDAAWAALEPNTSSHSIANWQVIEVRQVAGREVAEQFADTTFYGCPGPKPPANEAIEPTSDYWYVDMEPRPATSVPRNRTVSPTEPPAIPEPFTRQALFLIDVADGRVVARKLFCVVY